MQELYLPSVLKSIILLLARLACIWAKPSWGPTSIFISQILSRQQTQQGFLRKSKQTNQPSDRTFKGKFIDGPFTKLKYAKCLIHMYEDAPMTFSEERHDVLWKPRRHSLGKTFCSPRKSRDSAWLGNGKESGYRVTSVSSTGESLSQTSPCFVIPSPVTSGSRVAWPGLWAACHGDGRFPLHTQIEYLLFIWS